MMSRLLLMPGGKLTDGAATHHHARAGRSGATTRCGEARYPAGINADQHPQPAPRVRLHGEEQTRETFPFPATHEGPRENLLRKQRPHVTRVITENGPCYRSGASTTFSASRSPTNSHAHTGYRPTEKSIASGAPSPGDGLTPKPISPDEARAATDHAWIHSYYHYGPTPSSAASHLLNAFTTSPGTTAGTQPISTSTTCTDGNKPHLAGPVAGCGRVQVW